MGAFNTVKTTAACPSCEHPGPVVAQLKHGDTWQHTYEIGGTLHWGGNDIGTAAARHVVVDGIAEGSCSRGGTSREWSLYVHVQQGRITAIETSTGQYDFVSAERTHIEPSG